MPDRSEANQITTTSLVLVLLAALSGVWIARADLVVVTLAPPVVVVAWSVIPYASRMHNQAVCLWVAAVIQTAITVAYWVVRAG